MSENSKQLIPEDKQIIRIAIVIIVVIIVFIVAFYIWESIRTHTIYIKIEYNGKWYGVIGYGLKTESVDGRGDETFKITWKGSGWIIVTVVIQKMDGSYNRLWVGILDENQHILTSGETTSPYGVVSISWNS